MAIEPDSKLNKRLNETQWVIQISQLLQRENLETALEIPTSIFKLPHSLTNHKPEAYFPHHIALGPYHHFNQDLYKIELYKLENAIKAIEFYHLPDFNQILDELKRSETRIRALFDRYIDIGSEAFARIMLLDGFFLIQLLAISYEENNVVRKYYEKLPSPFPLFVEQKLYHYLIDENQMTQDQFLKDIIMLENQIPLLVLKTLLPQEFKNNLHLLFFKFCVFISPKTLPNHDSPEFMELRYYTDLSEMLEKSHHLLHFLYLLIMDYDRSPDESVGCAMFDFSFLMELFNILTSVLQIAFLQQLSEAIGLIQSLFGLLRKVKNSESFKEDKPPFIPSVSELENVGVEFGRGSYDLLQSIVFKEYPKVYLELPDIAVNTFSEVVLRNLVAFEASAKLKPPYFSSYVILMSGLIQTVKDVKILEKEMVIERHLRNEEEVVNLFNGLREVVEFHQQINPNEFEIVKKINEFYESCWKVKAKRFIKRYIHPILKGIFIIIVIFLIVVVVVRTFCGWFGCKKILWHKLHYDVKVQNSLYYI